MINIIGEYTKLISAGNVSQYHVKVKKKSTNIAMVIDIFYFQFKFANVNSIRPSE